MGDCDYLFGRVGNLSKLQLVIGCPCFGSFGCLAIPRAPVT